MTSLTLSFNDVNFTPVQQGGQIWLSASELAKALGYAKSDAVGQVYERNQDEFNSSMTTTITVKSDESVETLNLSVSKKTKNLTKTIRIFSLRGCHLIAMFSKTVIAKQFRKWVLDILDKEVGQPITKTHKSEREPLTNAVNMLVAKTKHLNYSDAYKLVHQRFNVKSIDEIPYDAIPVAVEYTHHLIALYSNAEKQKFTDADLQNIHALATHMIWARSWWSEFGDFVKQLNPTIYSRATSHFNDGACLAWQFVKIEKKQKLKECVDSFDWIIGTYQQKLPI
ncbi:MULTISPECIES: BRO family protein [Acinetobacter]|uniref:Bro-N domain-containing protein n=1 Tax=Acinetobacter piscicola TaxID=2006115 RepID=A0A7S7AGX1_9GAMM|nr:MULTISPECIES: BRO family protein [Acinetobacter]QOW45785.1 hypothetical protein G0028_07695 [Acinetobacter piscicola]